MNKVNLGAGKKPMIGYINVDKEKFPGVSVVHDLDKFPYPFGTSTVDRVLMDNVLEHLDDPIRVMKELHRITKPFGLIKIIVPYWNSSGAWQDLTHKQYFSYDSFNYFKEYSNYLYEYYCPPFKVISVSPKGIKRILSLFVSNVVSELVFVLRPIKVGEE